MDHKLTKLCIRPNKQIWLRMWHDALGLDAMTGVVGSSLVGGMLAGDTTPGISSLGYWDQM